MESGLNDIEDLENVLCRVPDWKAFLKAEDTDGDGKIEYNEFISAASNRQTLITEANIGVAFRMLDINKNNFITVNELHEAFAGQSCIEDDDVWKDMLK